MWCYPYSMVHYYERIQSKPAGEKHVGRSPGIWAQAPKSLSQCSNTGQDYFLRCRVMTTLVQKDPDGRLDLQPCGVLGGNRADEMHSVKDKDSAERIAARVAQVIMRSNASNHSLDAAQVRLLLACAHSPEMDHNRESQKTLTLQNMTGLKDAGGKESAVDFYSLPFSTLPFGRREICTEKHRGKCHVKMEAEIGAIWGNVYVCKPRNTKHCQQSPEPEEGPGTDSH
ncbi:uncharacterized protein [Chlorocebus sabaeus]|uniref:uncharacterized protein n=1 Tax=Chlorocebus sabaeus TaxID=60711 RepID=UPI0018B0385D|nr:uncharacterized protein LOC119620795 isoform X2 [Chlorocebus sabaeus]